MTNADERAFQSRISQAAGTNAQVAIRHLARAAALEEQLDDGSHNEHQLFFIVRALCNEHGHDYASVVDSARRYAQGVMTNAINVI